MQHMNIGIYFMKHSRRLQACSQCRSANVEKPLDCEIEYLSISMLHLHSYMANLVADGRARGNYPRFHPLSD